MTVRRLWLAMCATALATLAPGVAGARTVSLTPAVLDSVERETGERARFLLVRTRLPDSGRVVRSEGSPAWRSPPVRVGGRSCRAHAAVFASASPRPFSLGWLPRRGAGHLRLEFRSGRPAARFAYERRAGVLRLVRSPYHYAILTGRLPAEVAPPFPARHFTLGGVFYVAGPPACRPAAERVGRRALDRAVAGLRVVVGSYVPPPPDLPPPTVDLARAPALRIHGFGPEEGDAVASAGDFNGDGVPDLGVGGLGMDARSGAAHVVHGRASAGAVDVRDPAAGLSIGPPDRGGRGSVVGLGDLNGDGLGEVAVGAPRQGRTGLVGVVFGRRAAGRVALDARAGVVRIHGHGPCRRAGEEIANVGDVDGGGRADLAVVVPDGCGRRASRVYVVFGERLDRDVDVRRFAGRGFVIRGLPPSSSGEVSVGAAGDADGDGFDDLAIGLPDRDSPGDGRGSVVVVYGERRLAPLRLTSLGTRGRRIRGARCDALGVAVSPAGDFDGDGLDDLVVGAPRACEGTVPLPARAYVVYGRRERTNLVLDRPGTGALRIEGSRRGGLGHAVAGAGDRNGDGLADVVLGAPEHSWRGRNAAGAVFVVHGARRRAGRIELRRLGTAGERYVGPRAWSGLGRAVSPVGDLDGDGVDDLALGALVPRASGPFRGVVYVTRGRPG